MAAPWRNDSSHFFIFL